MSFSGEWFYGTGFHRGAFRGGFSPGTETGCIFGTSIFAAYVLAHFWSYKGNF